MTRFVNLPIRSQLITLALMLTLPALAIIVFSGYREYNADYRQAVIESQRLAENIAAHQEVLIREARQLCQLLSELPNVRNRRTGETEALITAIHKGNRHYSNIYIADAAGNVWASAVHMDQPYSVADRRYFINARETAQFSSGEYVVGKFSKKPAIHFAYPIIAQGVFKGAVIVGFDLDILRIILEQSQMPVYANYILADHKGIIVSRGKDVGQEVGKPIKAADLQRMQKGPEKETYEFNRIDGERRITTYRKIWLEGERSPCLYVRAGMSKSGALAPAKRALAINVTLLSLFVLFAFGIAFIIGKRSIVDRVAILKQASQRMAGGDLNVEVQNRISGGELGELSTTFDDMARQLALREQALLESESNYRDIFNATHDALFVHDATSGKIIEVNNRAEKIFGYRREEFLQPPPAGAAAGPGYLPESESGRLAMALSEGVQEFECLSRKKSGELFWIEVMLLPTSLAGSRRILAMVRDITVRKEMEQIKDEMLATVSHEMRTPLTAMLGFLEFVIENPVEHEQMRDYHFIMQKEAERLNEMVNNFLDMQRLKSKKASYDLTPLDIRPVMAEAAAIFTGPAGKHRIIEELPVELPLVRGNGELLHQALRNLLSNAVKYSPEGSSIIFGAVWAEESVTIWVKDEGSGIPAEACEKVFDMFYRVNGSAGRQATGTGLGLALVKEIISAHDGRVWVESSPGQGSTFYLSLPAAAGTTV